jgi:hypothetical protein
VESLANFPLTLGECVHIQSGADQDDGGEVGNGEGEGDGDGDGDGDGTKST